MMSTYTYSVVIHDEDSASINYRGSHYELTWATGAEAGWRVNGLFLCPLQQQDGTDMDVFAAVGHAVRFVYGLAMQVESSLSCVRSL